MERAGEVVCYNEVRWQVERFFHALKNGTYIEDPRLDRADDLCNCLAFDATTMVCAPAAHSGTRIVRCPSSPTIRGVVVSVGGLADFHALRHRTDIEVVHC